MENGTIALMCRLPRAQDLQELCDLAYEILGNPVFITDLAHTILAYTRRVKIEDPTWQRFIVESHLERKTITQDREVSVVHSESSEEGRPVLVEDSFLPYPRLIKTLTEHGNAIGIMVVTAYLRPFAPGDEELVELISSFAMSRMTQERYHLSENVHTLDNYFIRLLDGAQFSRERVLKRLEILGYKKHSCVYVLAIHAEARAGQPPEEIGSLLAQFHRIGGCYALFYNSSIVCLYGTEEELTDWETQAPELTALLTRENLIAGVSRTVSDMSLMREYYRQAQRTEEVGVRLGRSGRYFCYDSYASFLLLMELPREKLRDFCHQKIRDLGAYDDTHDTELCVTLQVYLEQAKSLARTAELLYIHRNTVRYRIHKCMELMKTDLEDGNEIFAYILSLRILEYVKKFLPDKEGMTNGKNL